MSTSQPQTVSVPNGEEMVKRVLVVAELLTKSMKPNKERTQPSQEKGDKTQNAEPVVSS